MGYWQVGVHSEDQDQTAFATGDGLYNFKAMPYGLCNSGATFQRLMELILTGLTWSTCLLYVDDIICFSKTVDEHVVRLDEIVSRIRDAGLKLSPGKWKFFQHQVSFLGHTVSQRGIATDPEKTREPVPCRRILLAVQCPLSLLLGIPLTFSLRQVYPRFSPPHLIPW